MEIHLMDRSMVISSNDDSIVVDVTYHNHGQVLTFKFDKQHINECFVYRTNEGEVSYDANCPFQDMRTSHSRFIIMNMVQFNVKNRMYNNLNFTFTLKRYHTSRLLELCEV